MTRDSPLTVMTVVGTRPEIIRLSPTIKRLDDVMNHVLVHTGQNYDYELNGVFFEDLSLRRPDRFLEADTTTLGSMLGTILSRVEQVIAEVKPDAMLVLGDTNSCISAIMAKRMRIPVFHMEAGNRCFDENVPEETNRRLVDHVSDYNLVYTEHARRNLLSEGIHPSRIALTGSPMNEVLAQNSVAIAGSDAVQQQGLQNKKYFMVSLHREENVDNRERLSTILHALQRLSQEHSLPVLVSTHPRTRARLEALSDTDRFGVIFQKPFGFHDYISLQKHARLVLSDSGTISEEASLLGFPAVTIRDMIERPEALDTGVITTSGTQVSDIVDSVDFALGIFEADGAARVPVDYQIHDTSRRVVNFIRSMIPAHKLRTGIR
ncbi:non-hydrolyzing UDP-N-acetylglucosamine 2-epimerase [Paramicrobacterium fandaimingii]|uniref:non-hydrolyzing UDP-N-acetylglucosamine 2-epimerase n=1 Tax=Paramicrobacterium fandaimingii TaxID=2708079 RepID=UPI0014238081|nr:UDP-N-acetylglucosamine 2-epimerase (non-hydrolyzing) [Microbacterium fandaimingii]